MMNLSFMNPGVMRSKNNPNIMNMMSMFANQNITGSIKLLPAMINGVRSQIKASLGDAVMTAQKEFGNNSQAVAANIGVEDGSLVYTIWGVDPDMNLHMVIIDPGNGKLLLSQKISLLQMMMGGMMNPGMMGGMMNPGIMSHMWR
jgi:hypothetical protein